MLHDAIELAYDRGSYRSPASHHSLRIVAGLSA